MSTTLSNEDKEGIAAVAASIRSLSIDAIQKANSGHPGLPLGCADFAAQLFSLRLSHDPDAPSWANRDRFVLSAGHGSMLMYSLLHLYGYGLPLDEIKQFRQLGSLTPGHPEFGLDAGIETTTGPLGAGFSNAVGMAIAEAWLAQQFNTKEHTIVDHKTWVLSGDGCMMEGVSSEAASLAGHLGLGKLVVFYDSNTITIEGHTDIAFTESVEDRFKAYGWRILHSDAQDGNKLAQTFAEIEKPSEKPTLVVMKSIIGFGSPNKQGSHEVHGAALGADEVAATKKNLGLDPAQFFQILPAAERYIASRKSNFKKARTTWEATFAAWAKANPEKKLLWDQAHGLAAPKAIAWPQFAVGEKVATRSSSGKVMQAIAAALPYFIGGSADLAPSNSSDIKGGGDFQKETRAGRNFHFGVREHGMGGAVNGMVLHGGLKAYGATFLVFADYMRPTLRLAAIMKIPSIFILTHDSIWVGEDGPTHQPVETISSLRAIPGFELLRPADAEESAFAWELALEKGYGSHHAAGASRKPSFDPASGPTGLALTRQALVVFAKPAGWKDDVRQKGAYVVSSSSNWDSASKKLVIFSSGSELGVAISAVAELEKGGAAVRVVSVPSVDRFRAHIKTKGKKSDWIPAGAKAFGIEAGISDSWTWLLDDENFLGMDSFGESGPGDKVAAYFGLDQAGLVKFIQERSK